MKLVRHLTGKGKERERETPPLMLAINIEQTSWEKVVGIRRTFKIQSSLLEFKKCFFLILYLPEKAK